MSKVYKIEKCSTNNGEGVRTSIFFSGCDTYCQDCFNKELWNFEVGESFNKEYYETQIKPTINEHIAGISILGGEPLNIKNIVSVWELIYWFKTDFPNKTIWLWSGYLFEDILKATFDVDMRIRGEINIEGTMTMSYRNNILKYIDVLVDGVYEKDKRDLTLKWRGSSNQRVIDVQESLKQNKVILYCD